MPRTAPVVKTGQVSTEEIEIPQPAPRVQASAGKAALSAEKLDIEPAQHVDPEWAALMAFNKEKITIRVLDTNEPNEIKIVEVWNNGDLMQFPRGQEVTCERRFVESLIRAKPTTYTQKPVLDERGGVAEYQNVSHRALRYPFVVVADANPLGGAWLKSSLAQP